MKIYIQEHKAHAGYWIYKGYESAWLKQGFSPVIADISTIEPKEVQYMIMTTDTAITNINVELLEKAHKVFLFVQPTEFPLPWGRHPNFVTACDTSLIAAINKLEHVHKWTFSDGLSHYKWWENVHTIPLAFDNLNYAHVKNEVYSKYDIVFVGGWANNGFDEKRHIMINNFKAFKDSNLNCGFFINKGISHKQETELLSSAKVTINIHDAYQRILGHDTNERTFKSLGLNGILVSDKITQLENLFPYVVTSNNPIELVKTTKDYLSLTEEELKEIKEENRQNILDNHCYTHRVQQLLSL